MTTQIRTENFGKNLKAVREVMGFSQKEIADMTKLTPSAISQLEKGERNPSLQTVVKIANGLKIKIDRLVT